jgi:hypothetical protein
MKIFKLPFRVTSIQRCLSGYLPRMLWKLICVTTQTHASMSSVAFLGLKDTGWVLPINFRKRWKIHWQFISCQIWPTVKHIYKLLKDNSVSSGCEMEPITEISLLPVLCLLKERPQVNDRNTCFLGHIFASLCIELCNFIGALWKLFCFITICRPVISLNHQTWTTKYLSHRKHGSRLSLTWQIHSVPPHQLEEV